MQYRLFVLLGCTTLAGLPAVPLRGEEFSPPPITSDAERELVNLQREKASLCDVVFVDAEHGWAAGNHGTIWHTTNGGQDWQLQPTPTTADLKGIAFVDRYHGWAVGGVTRPYLWTSQAVVLRTINGGRTWQQHLALIPALESVQFFDAAKGVAWGRGSGGYPLGVFATEDGGRNWRPLATGLARSWTGGQFADPSHGILVDDARHVARIEYGDWLPSALDDANLPPGSLHAAHFDSQGHAWMAGDRGMIMRSADAGESWQRVRVLPDELATQISWRSIACRGELLWIVGDPGTVVLHSADLGQTWQGQGTGSRMRLNRVTFLDAEQGWAVGELGTILHTADGGATWKVQHQAATGVDLLIVLESCDQLPLATLGKTALTDGHTVAVHLLSVPDDSPDCTARLAEALSLLGCDSASFGNVDRTGDDAADREHLLREFARLLRTWQPAALVVPETDDESLDLVELAKQAAQLAGGESELPRLKDQLALELWETKRIFALLSPGTRGTHRVELDPTWQAGDRSLVDRASAAFGLLRCDYSPSPDVEEFQLAVSLSGDPGLVSNDLLAGLSTHGNGFSSAANLLVFDPREKQRQRRLAEKRRNLQNIFRAAGGNPALLAQVTPMIADLDPASGAQLLFELAEQFAGSGSPELQAETLELLARRYPDDPLVDHTLVWLVQYYASGETAHVAPGSLSPQAPSLAATVAAPHTHETSEQGDGVQLASAEQEIPQPLAERLTRAVQITQHIAHTRPLLYAEPQLRVPWARAEIRRREDQGAQKYLESLALRYPGDPWQARGEAERWLADPATRPPRMPVLVCRPTDERPTLDGKLNEPMWQAAWTKLEPAATGDARCKFACDQEFLYLALRCSKSPGESYTTADGTRTYDADLDGNDRVVLHLDIDRDYASYYELAVDYRGWTHDSCWGNLSWNPRWFVAADSTPEEWAIEAAIPWSALTYAPPNKGDAWAIAISRFSSQRLMQRLQAQDEESAEFGLLLFR